MKKKLWTGLVFGMMMFVMVKMTSAAVLTFDDITAPDTEEGPGSKYVPDGYGGLNWSDMVALNPFVHPVGSDNGYGRGLVSGNWVAMNWYDAVTTTSGKFDFTGAYFTSAWDEVNTIEAKGYLSGAEIYNNSWIINNLSPTWIHADFQNIDTLTLNTTGNHFAMDNFTYKLVPEPSAILLFGAGIAVFAVSGLRRKNSSQ